MPETMVTILNAAGLHARPATRLVELANRFEAAVTITYDGRTVNAKSVLEVLTLAAAKDTELRVAADGADADAALAAIEELVATRFGFEEA
jgi:phosphocarrier protein HPr